MKKCSNCGKESREIRKTLCQRCYLAQYRGISKGPECECCGITDQRVLKRKRLDGQTWSTLCANCCSIAGRVKMTIEKLKEMRYPEGDRRRQDRRRSSSRRRLDRRNYDIGERLDNGEDHRDTKGRREEDQ